MAHHKKPVKPAAKQSVKDILKLRKKESKKKLQEKRARLVVKNLPFGATEENLKEYFTKYGDIKDIQILKKEDGKLLGCAFIQFRLVQKARKAKHHANGQLFQGRNLDVDFALPKKQYEKNKVDTQIKLESDVKVKEEPVDDEEEKVNSKLISIKTDTEDISLDETKDTNSEEDEDSTDQEMDEEEEELELKEEFDSRPRTISNDVSEGKTIFIKNVPFSANNDDLKECMSQFGPTYYALICVDKLTEHSKGTGFVKFCFKEDAEKALDAGTELKLMGNILDCHRALNRNDVHSNVEQKTKNKNDVKDSRNLYLIKEGVVMAGSRAAEGVSGSDMAKRLQLEQYKTQMLKNLHMFISRERLVIHNIPPNWDDKKLRILCAKFAGKGAIVKEARIMRDFRDVDAKGVGKSKEFGFVTLNSHENALHLLRSLNNNPNIFSGSKRPVVSFSIEKKSAIKTKLKRMEKSRISNPKSKYFNPDKVKEALEPVKTEKKAEITHENLETFSGMPAKPGIQKMRSRYKLTVQAKKHHENLKKEKRKKKLVKKSLEEKKQEFTKQRKQKMKQSKDNNEDFMKLVSNYRKTISSVPNLKTKWYS